jgi:hypothetical protein
MEDGIPFSLEVKADNTEDKVKRTLLRTLIVRHIIICEMGGEKYGL